MNQGSSTNIVSRVISWLRGLITPKDAGQRQPPTENRAAGRGDWSGDASHQAARDGRGAGDITGTPGGTSSATIGTGGTPGGRQELPDLDASDSDYQYAGEPSTATNPPEQAGTGGPASEAAEEIIEYRSDLDDAAGDTDAEEVSFPAGEDDVSSLHDAVGGHDGEADGETDGVIDTSRDEEIDSPQPESPRIDNVPESDHDEPGVSEQDELSAFEGAGADEFAAGGYAPEPIDQEDVEAAAEGAPTSVPVEDEPENVEHQHQVGGTNGIDSPGEDVPEVSEYNYGLGDLGAGAMSTGAREAEPSESIREALAPSPSPESERPVGAESGNQGVPREVIESSAAGDAVAQGDEAVTAPGQDGPESFTDAETGTVEPSRSATGNDLDDERQDALGTTLEYTADEVDAFDTDAANLSGQEELSVIQNDVGEQEASFEDGEPAQAAPSLDAETEDSFADLPDEPAPEHTDDSGQDDFSGSAYPSDRRIDPLAGDDAFDADAPDPVNEFGSSAGDLDSGDTTEDLLITQLGEREGTDGDVGAADRAIDQDNVGTSDEHVGGEEPGFVDNLQRSSAQGGDAGPGAGTAVNADAAGADQDGGADSVPEGAVRGDGTTDTPPGYPIKGNASSKIYHLPEYPSYKGTKAEYCFATEEDAIAAGYRAPGKRNRGRGRKR